MWAFGLATCVLDHFQVQDPARIDPHRSQNHRAEPMLVSSMLLGSMDAQLSHVDQLCTARGTPQRQRCGGCRGSPASHRPETAMLLDSCWLQALVKDSIAGILVKSSHHQVPLHEGDEGMPCGQQSGEVPTLAIAKLLSTTSWDRVDIVRQPSLSAVELPDNMSLSGRSRCAPSPETSHCRSSLQGEVKLLDLWSSQRFLLLEVQDA